MLISKLISKSFYALKIIKNNYTNAEPVFSQVFDYVRMVQNHKRSMFH